MSLHETAEKIRSMETRGAGRIARAAAEALKDYAAMVQASSPEDFRRQMEHAGSLLVATRPTAVSLPNAVRSVLTAIDGSANVDSAREKVIRRADAFITASLHAVERIGEIGSRHIKSGDVLLTHCNSEAALSCMFAARRQGKDFHVFATEVRPGNQGLITIKMLDDAGIPTSFIVDSAVRFFMNKIDTVFVGADAIAVNGAVVNKIGTSQVALVAHEARTNFIVAAETYKFAPRTILGELIEIEERAGNEVLPAAVARTLPCVTIRNPVFDVTPPSYVDLIVTEMGAIPPGLAYMVLKEHLGWSIDEFHKEFEIHHRDQE
ncbi:MAG: ribose 1,5-bisphosphate isomerase [Methanomicrobiales archaeon]|nr:ribose 1,5-bisphosphate isomerase [Methanomicrobiales archaeon]